MAALDYESIDAREAFLDEQCGDDSALRRRLKELLRAHDAPDDVLDRSAMERLPADAEHESLDFLSPASDPDALGMLGHYRVMQVLGRGGMGVVLRALDEKLHRQVAIKVLSPLLAASSNARQRFNREARAAAAVTHENIVAIHAIEDAGPVSYIVMNYVDGQTLQEKIDNTGPLSPLHLARIALQITDGLHAAHRQGLIHRDIKPSNILLENCTERVKITDFGLARAVDDASVTKSGIVAGTPAYMSPEQANGERVDHRSDLFSLGSVIYAMGTGQVPFRAESSLATLKRVCEESLVPLHEVNRDIPEWLAAIAERLMHKNPADRYQSASEVAEALAEGLSYLQGLGPVPKSSTTTRSKVGRRVVLTGGIVAVAGGIAAWRGGWLSPAMSDTYAALPVPTSEELARRESIADALRPSDLPAQVLDLARIGSPPVVPNQLVSVLTDERGQIPAGSQVFGVAITNDGKYVACSGWRDHTIRVWDMATRNVRHTFSGIHPHAYAVAFSPDGSALAGSDLNGGVRVWNLKTGAMQSSLQHKTIAYQVAFSPDGRFLATAGWDLPLTIWDWAKGTVVHKMELPRTFISAVAISPDGKHVAGGAHDGTAGIWDLKTGQLVVTLRHNGHETRWIGFHPNGRQLAVACAHRGTTQPARVWDLPTRSLRHELETAVDGVVSGAWRQDGQVLFLADATSGVVRAWDLSGQEPRSRHLTIVRPMPWLGAIALTPEGRHLVAGEPTGPILVFRLAERGQVFNVVDASKS